MVAVRDVRGAFGGVKGQGAVSFIDAPALLADLIASKGWGPKASDAQLAELGGLLAAAVARDRVWGRSYLSNILAGRVDASALFIRALSILGAISDGAPPELARSVPVQVRALGQVAPGALVLASSRPCAFIGCRVQFVPSCPRQVYHSPRCRLAAWRLAQALKKEGLL